MRRLTTKDLGKRKKVEDGPTPDFYSMSRENPLPESTPVPTTTLTPPALAAGGARNDGMHNADMELALLERRRADIFNRMNLLAGSNPMRPDAFGSSNFGQQDFQLNSNSLVAAAALSLGNGRSNHLGQPSLQQSFLGGGSNVGQIFDTSNSAFQRQLLEARLANSDMASFLGINQNSMQQGAMNGFGGFSMPPL